MNTLIRIPRHILTALAALYLVAEAHAQTSVRLSTRFLARGEQALLEITTIGKEPDALPSLPQIKGVTIESSGFGAQARVLPGRILAYSFQYIISSYETGDHRIPSLEVVTGGIRTKTEPVDFKVFDPDDLHWQEVSSGGRTMRYASSFLAMKSSVYEGETLPVEIKIYVPRDLMVEDWGVPEFERDGVASWRFEPGQMRGQINLLGAPYVSLAYPSTMSPTRTGKVGIGPASVRLTTIQVVMDGIVRRAYEELFLKVPKLEIESKQLPDGAPEGFENAVGEFSLNVTSGETEVREGDPVSVELIVSGSGNFDTMRPPKLIDPSGWKIYEATPSQRGDERRDLSGNVMFRQFMRPLESKSMIPPFRLVYFDPREEIYKTIVSEPIMLTITPGPAGTKLMESAAPPQALQVPVERMADILAILRPASLTIPAAGTFPSWLGHVLGGVIALGLILKAFWMRFAHLFRKNPEREARMGDLRKVTSVRSADDIDFLRAAGGFIERWLAENPDPEIQAVLSERDAVCFRSEKPAKVLDQGRREKILRLLRHAAGCLAFIAALFISTAGAEDVSARALEAYEAAKFEEAAKLWLEAAPYETLSPATLYNIGNASYRMGSPGHAALFYRRALARDSGFQEARQNLRFIERKFGSITVQRPEYQYALARAPLSVWKGAVWTGAWIVLLSLLVFPATRIGSNWRVAAVCGLVTGPLLASLGGLGWRYYPDDAEFAPVERQAVVLVEKSVLHSDAARTAPEVIDAPQGSLCEIIRESGRWAYVGFASGTRGWIPKESIEKIIPEGKPEVPKVRKPKADAKSA